MGAGCLDSARVWAQRTASRTPATGLATAGALQGKPGGKSLLGEPAAISRLHAPVEQRLAEEDLRIQWGAINVMRGTTENE